MPIEIVTFTGVDDHTDISRLSELAKRYPKLEFGVLAGTQVGGIFPTFCRIIDLSWDGECNGYRTALHLCGQFSRAIAASEDLTKIRELAEGFGRLQVNLHGDFLDPRYIPCNRGQRTAFVRLAQSLPNTQIILQHRDVWHTVPILHERIEYLFDRSAGAGQVAFNEWPAPHIGLHRMGYAGGLGPHNMHRAVEFAARYPGFRLWFDMESNVRTNGLFDLDKVEQVCRIVWGEEDTND